MNKTRVKLTLTSLIDGQTTEQQHVGDWYVKGEVVYIRYSEQDEMNGVVTTTLKCQRSELRLIRHGAVESLQVFVPHVRQAGYYQSLHSEFKMETMTHQLHVDVTRLPATIRWQYDLMVDDGIVGNFDIQLVVEQVE